MEYPLISMDWQIQLLLLLNMIFTTISTDQHFYSQIVDGSGHPLSGVLVSLSGANFRSNNFSKEGGRLDYHGLVIKLHLCEIVYEHCLCLLYSSVYGVNSLQNPGQYFIKPLLREFEFIPSSKVPEPHMYT